MMSAGNEHVVVRTGFSLVRVGRKYMNVGVEVRAQWTELAVPWVSRNVGRNQVRREEKAVRSRTSLMA